MFTVVIPLYNKELYIKSTIESVLNQDYQEFEIIVVNDGSSDNSANIVNGIKDKRIRLINQENQGVSAARNQGVKEACYEWITFLDGDDLWSKEHLLEFHNKIKMYPDTNWLFSGFTIHNISTKKNIEKKFNIDGKLSNIFDYLLAGIEIHTSTVCIRRNLFNTYNELYFRIGLNSSEDREVWYKLACIDKSPIYIPKSLSIYKIGVSESLIRKNLTNFNDHFLTMDKRIANFTNFITEEDKIKLFNFLKKFNRKSLISRYRTGHFKDSYKAHLNTFEYLLFKYTIKSPPLLRRLICKVLLR